MQTIVVDDEYWMLVRFQYECENLDMINLIGSFDQPSDALSFAEKNKIDLAFLDIKMPQISGIELASRLKELQPNISIVYISANEQYIAEAFCGHQSEYYLLKPYSAEEIRAVTDIVLKKDVPS